MQPVSLKVQKHKQKVGDEGGTATVRITRVFSKSDVPCTHIVAAI